MLRGCCHSTLRQEVVCEKQGTGFSLWFSPSSLDNPSYAHHSTSSDHPTLSTTPHKHPTNNPIIQTPHHDFKLAVSVSSQHCLDMVHPGPTHVGGSSSLLDQLRSALGGDQGEVAQLLQQGGVPMDDGLLQRWLTAKKNDVETAAAALAEHARWRAEFVPGGRILQVIVCLDSR